MSHNPYKKGFDMLLADIEKHEGRNDEIMKLAKNSRIRTNVENLMSNPTTIRIHFECYEKELEAFYNAAFNAGVAAAAEWMTSDYAAHEIRTLEKK